MGRESAAERLARQLEGTAAPSHDGRIRGMLRAAQALQPAEPLSRAAHERGKAAMLAAFRRAQEMPAPTETAGSRDGEGELVPHTVQVVRPDGVRVVMADVERIDPERAALIAEQSAALIAKHLPARAEEPL